jgi:hypothetical protein
LMEERPSKHFTPARRNIGRRPWRPGQPNQCASRKRRGLKLVEKVLNRTVLNRTVSLASGFRYNLRRVAKAKSCIGKLAQEIVNRE